MPATRRELIEQFLLAHKLDNHYEKLAGDASLRSYYRLRAPAHSTFASSNLILMDSAYESVEPFIKVHKILSASNIANVQIYASDIDNGLLLLDDLGDISFFQQLQNADNISLYKLAIDLLINMQSAPCATLTDYDHARLLSEMQLFDAWFLQRHIKLTLPAKLQTQLAASMQYLCSQALMQPQVFVHRDYHCRNIFYHQQQLHLIDFQDANRGPLCYDLVSLLRDCYLRLEPEMLQGLLVYYCQHSPQLQQHSIEQVRAWFDLIGVQRHLKVAGIFARLYYRDHKLNYLADIALALHYLLEVCPHYAQTQIIANIIADFDLLAKSRQLAQELAG